MYALYVVDKGGDKVHCNINNMLSHTTMYMVKFLVLF